MRSTRSAAAWALSIGLLAAMTAGSNARDAADTLTVAQDGSGDVETIAAAIEAATDGDAILIAPGKYVENLFIDKAVTLSGDGAREQVVIKLDRDEPQILNMDPDGRIPIAIYVDGADVTIEHLTVDSGPSTSHGTSTSLVLMGGSSVVRDIVTTGFVGVRGDAVALIEGSDIMRVGIFGPNESVIRDNTVHDRIWASEGSRGIAEGNLVLDHPIVVDSGAHLEITDNTIRPGDEEPGIIVEDVETSALAGGNKIEGGWVGVLILPGTSVAVTDNVIDTRGVAVLAEFPQDVRIEGNTISGGDAGIVAVESASIVRDNTITDAASDGLVVVGEGWLIEGNVVDGGRIGLRTEPLGPGGPDEAEAIDTPSRIEGNTITGASHFGVVIEGTRTVIIDNTICAGREPLKLAGGAEPEMGSNDICEVE